MATEEKILKTECRACRGTGVFHGFAEPKGVGVVCLDCDGTGCKEISYIPFTSRKDRDDIDRVMLSRGRFIMGGCGPTGISVSYRDFQLGKMPQSPNKGGDDQT